MIKSMSHRRINSLRIEYIAVVKQIHHVNQGESCQHNDNIKFINSFMNTNFFIDTNNQCRIKDLMRPWPQ